MKSEKMKVNLIKELKNIEYKRNSPDQIKEEKKEEDFNNSSFLQILKEQNKEK